VEIIAEGKTWTNGIGGPVVLPLLFAWEFDAGFGENSLDLGTPLFDSVGTLGTEADDASGKECSELLVRASPWPPVLWVVVAADEHEVASVRHEPTFDRVLHAKPVGELEDKGDWYLRVKVVKNDGSFAVVSVEPGLPICRSGEGDVVDVREMLPNPAALASASRSVHNEYS